MQAVEASPLDRHSKGFFHFNRLAGPEPSETIQQPEGPAGEMLRGRFARAKRDPGELLETFVADELAQDALGNDPAKQSYLPGVPEGHEALAVDRIFRSYKKRQMREAAIMDLPEWGQLQEWLKANPGGKFEKAPDYMAQAIDAAPSRTDRQMAAQEEIGRISNALNQAWHQQVDPKTSAQSGMVVGEAMRRLNGIAVPHAFEDAPMLQKLGVGITESVGVPTIAAFDTISDTGLDAFYASAKVTRNLFAPGAPLPEWIENNYHAGAMELAAVLQQTMGLESVPWDEESGQLISRKQLQDRTSESLWLSSLAIGGHLAGFVANPILGGSAMAAAGAQGASIATKGMAWIMGSAKYPKLAALLGATAGVGVFNGLLEAIQMGQKGPLTADGIREHERGFLGAYAHGFMMAPIFTVAGVMGGKAGDLLLRGGAPSWVARGVGGIFEGLGFGQMEDLSRGKDSTLWKLMREPTKENLDRWMTGMGANALAMSLFHLVHASPQRLMRDRILREQGVDISSDLPELQRRAQEEGRARAIVSEAQVVDPQAPFSELFFRQRTTREQRVELAEKAREMGERGREEYEVERKIGVASEHLVKPEGEMPSDVKLIARDAPLRALEWNRRRIAEGDLTEQGGFVVFGKEGVERVGTKEAEPGVKGSLPMDKVWEEMRQGNVNIADWHTHGNDSFFSGSQADLGVFREMARMYERRAPEEVKNRRVPFITVGSGHFLVATKIPGVELPSEKMIGRAFDLSKGAAVEGIKGEIGKKSDIQLQRKTLQERADHGAWDSIGLEMKTYTPREFQVLWRDYIDTGVWKTDPMQVEHYAQEVSRRQEVLGESRVTPGIYPDIGEFKPTSPVEKRELAREPDIEGFTRTGSEITGEHVPPTQTGVRRVTELTGEERPELAGEREGLYHAEPVLPHPPMAEAGEPPLRGKFDPNRLAKGEEKLAALFRRDRETGPGMLRGAMTATAKYFKEVFHGQRSIMKDVREGRLAAAEAIEKLGYRHRFRKLGEFEDQFVAEVDRLSTEVSQSSRVAGQRVMDAFDPIAKLGGEGVEKGQLEGRQKALHETLEYLYLKDFLASADRDEPLPLDLGRDQVEARLKDMEGALSPEQRQAAQNIRALLDEAGSQLVRRGVLRREDLRADYMPHKVVDYFDAFSSFTPGRTVGKLRRPFAGYTKARKGSERMIDTSEEALHAYLTQVQKDNAVHDFIRRNGEEVHQRVVDALQQAGVNVDWKRMSGADWATARQDLTDRGLVVYDARFGELGKHSLTQDPTAQAIYRFFSDKGEMEMPQIPELGKNVKPAPGSQVYLVPKEVANLWLDIRAPRKSIVSSPLLAQVRRMLGSWYKAPALRGIFGLATIPRQGRNLISDVGAIAFKKSIGDAVGILRNLPEGHRLARALANREWRKENLSPSEEGLLQEMELYGSVQTGETQEALGHEQRWSDHPTFKQIYGDWNKWWNLKKHYRGDYKWVNAVDTYSENLFRSTVWMHERSKLIADGLDAQAAARQAHLETGRLLVDYRHLTPLEANVLNSIAFPFYTWIRHQVTSTVGEGLRRPMSMVAKYGMVHAAIAAWNALMAQDEDSKLIQTGHRAATLPHVWLPWLKDSDGNPFLMSWEMPVDMTARFFGVGGVGSKLGDYLFGHGDESILWRDLAGGGLEESALTGGRFLQDWMAPWFRAAGGWLGFRSKFVTPGELVSSQAEKGITAMRPVADVIRMLDERKSIAQRASSWLPIGRFVDISQGVPARHRQLEYYGGRQQRHEAQLSNDVQDWTPRVSRLLKAQDFDGARAIVDKVWAQWADELAPLGYTQEHLANRFWKSVQRRWRQELLEQQPGPAGARFFSLSEQQRLRALKEMGYFDEEADANESVGNSQR